MNAATQELIRQRRSEGAAPADVAQEIAGDPRLARDIDRKEFGVYLVKTDLDERLDAAKTDLAVPEPLRKGLRKLDRLVAFGADWLGTQSNLADATQIQQILGGLVMVGVMTPDEHADLIQQWGGPYYQATLAEIEAEYARLERTEQVEALQVRVRQFAGDCEARLNQLLTAGDPLPTWDDLKTEFGA